MSQRADLDDLRLVAARDQAALRRLYDRHARMLGRRLLRMRADVAMVEEALQDTFVAVWQRPDAYAGHGEVAAWLWGIARNVMRGMLRAEASRAHGHSTTLHEDQVPVGDSTDESDLRMDVAAALDRLGPDQRATWDLVAGGYASHEVADLLDVSPATVRTRMHRIRTSLANLLDRS